MKVYLRVIEGKDIPIMDVGGLCDAYCKIKFGQQKAQTRIIDYSLTPHWRQEFSFDVLDIQNDFLFIQLYDHDNIGKDEIISDLSIKINELKPGEIIDKWFNMNQIEKKTIPKIHLIIHLAEDKDIKFISNPFQIYVTNIRIMTVKDVEPGEYFITFGYKKDLILTTRKSKDLIWQEEFIVSMPKDEPVLTVNLNKGKNIISFVKIFTGIDVGEIEKKWYKLNDKGSIKIAFQVTPYGTKPFENEKFDDEFSPPTELTAYFRFFEGKDLTPMDSNGKNDAYCTVVNLSNPKIIKKTQIIYETTYPKWNFFINIKIYDYETDIIRINCYDYDTIGSDDLIGYIDLKVREMGKGEIITKWLDIYNQNYKSEGSLFIMYQICTIGWIPFDPKPLLNLRQINIHLMDGYDIPNTDLIGKTDPYVRLKLNDQEFVHKTKVINNTLNPCWNETITLYSLCQEISLQIELRDEATGKDPLIGTKDINLNELKYGEIKEITEELTPAKGMKKGGKIHFYVQESTIEPFKNYKFEKYIDTGKKTKRGNGNLDTLDKKPINKPLQLFIKIVRAFNLKSCDSNGLSDPYCILQINNQKKTTSIIYECLNPKWDEYFIFDINSLNYDILTITCMDYDLLSSDDLIGIISIPLKSVIYGKVFPYKLKLYDKESKISGELEFIIHVAKMGDIPFEEKLWNQKVLNVRILEGTNLPNGYLYWIGKLDNEKDIQFTSSQNKESKWFQQYQLIYSYENDAILKLYEHSKKEIELGELKIPYNSIKSDTVVDKIFNFGRNWNIHLILEIKDFGYPPFSTLPALDINKEKLFLCESLTLNVKIIEAKNLPSDKSETYCKLYLLGAKPKEKIGEVRTKNSKKGANPVWNEEYHFPIRSLGTDALCIELKQRGTMGREIATSSYILNTNTIPYGAPINAWFKFSPEKGFSTGGKVHIQYQLAGPGNYAFINKPFTVKTLYIKIIEGKEIRVKNLSGLADPYCQMQMIGDRVFLNTKIIEGTLSPCWDENFSFLITNYETDSFKLILKDNNNEIGLVELKMKQFEIGKCYSKWLEVQNKGKKTGLIKSIISVVEPGIEPFSGELIEDKINFPPSQNWQVNIHLLGANNLPSSDSNGLSDPYCLFKILNTDISIKTRKIDKSLNPMWDDYLQIPIKSLNSDIIRLEIMDWDRIGKHDKLCMKDISLNEHKPGEIYKNKYTLIPLEGNESGSTIDLIFQITPPSFIPFSAINYTNQQLNIRIEDIFGISTKKVLKNPNFFFNLKLESDTNEGIKSMTKNELNTIIKENFSFILTDYKTDKLIIEYRNDEDKNEVIAKTILPLANIQNEETKEMNLSLEPSGNLHLFVQIDKQTEVPFKDKEFTPLSNPYMTFYIKIIKGYDIPPADKTGLSDPFCVLELQGRKENKKTSIKTQTLTPTWNQTFQFKILSYNKDRFILSLYDYDKFSKNDLLGQWSKNINEIEPGVVFNTNIKAGGNILVQYHLAYAGDPPFITKPFKVYILNIKVLEAKDITTKNISGVADLFCQMSIVGDLEFSKTKVKEGTLSPSWNETFSFFIANYQTDLFKLELKEKGKDNNIGEIILEVKKFDKGKRYLKWVEVKNNNKTAGLIKVEINLTEKGEKPFDGPLIEEKMEFKPSEQWEFNIHLIKATNLPSADSNGLSDPYCLFKILNTNISIKSRRIDKTLNPIWDDYLKIPIKSLNSDIIRLEINDWDRVGKDDKLCMKDFPLKSFIVGKVYHETFSLIPLAGNKEGSTIELSFQITPPSEIPFIPSEYNLDQLNIRIEDVSSVTSTQLKTGKFYIALRLESDTDEGYLTDTKDELNSIYHEDFNFILTEKDKEKLIIEYKNDPDNCQTISKCEITLANFEYGKTKEVKTSMEPSGEIHLFLQINDKNVKPFDDINLSPHINPYTTFYIKIISGINIPVADDTGLSDPFCVLELKDRKEKKKTLIRKQTLTPIWNQTFQFKILSYNTDVFILSLYDYDKYSKNDFLGKWEINIKDIKPGIVIDNTINAGGLIHVIYQLAGSNQIQWENKEKPVYHLNVKVIEAKEFPNNAGKTDPFIQLFYKDDIIKKRTKTLDNTLTPQWFESFNFSFIDLEEPLIIRLIDDNILKNSEMAEICIKKINKYELNYIYEDWFKMEPLGAYKTGGKIRLEFQFTDNNTKPFEGPRDLPPRLPVCETKMSFNIKIIKGEINENNNITKDYYCQLEFVGRPESIKKTRTIENNSKPYWDEFYQFDIKSLTDVFKISLCDSKNVIISYYTIDLEKCDFGIKKEEALNMVQYSPSVDYPGKIYIIYQIAKPCQEIFVSERFEVDIFTCYVESFETAIPGGEYYCEVKTIDSIKGKFSKVTFDNLIMEKFNLPLRKNQNETLEIIINQIEKKGKFKFAKEIKRIKYEIEELGEHEIEGIKFALQMNCPDVKYPEHPITLYPKRYIHLLIEECNFKYKNAITNFKNSFIKVSLNYLNKEKRYSERTRIIFNEQNPKFRHIFHLPVFSIKDDIIYIKVYEYNKKGKKEKLFSTSIVIKNFRLGECINEIKENAIINLKYSFHFCEANQPPFITNLSAIQYLCIRMFEVELKKSASICMSLTMKNDLYHTQKLISTESIKRPTFGGNILQVPISNKNDPFFLTALNHNLSDIYLSKEFETKDLEPNFIYRFSKNGFRFWAEIVNGGEKPFTNENFYGYYNQLPNECYMVYVEIKEFVNLPKIEDYEYPKIDYIISFGRERFTSRSFYSNLYNKYYDEYKFKAVNLEEKLNIIVNYNDKNIYEFALDLTEEEFGKVIEKDYIISPSYYSPPTVKIKWQVTEPCQSRWDDKKITINSLNLHIGRYQTYKNKYEFWKIRFENIKEKTIITNCGAFNQTFSFILTNQDKIIFEQYFLDSNNFEKLNQTIPINILNLKNNEPFNIIEDLSAFIEIVPYKTPPFKGQNFPLYFTPKSLLTVAIMLKDGNDFGFPEEFYINFKYKDRSFLDEKSIKIRKYDKLLFNQYFNFDVKSFRDDILEIYAFDKKKELGKKEIVIKDLLYDKNSNKNFIFGEKGNINMKIQLVPPKTIPFSDFMIEMEYIFIKFLYGENIKNGDLFCQFKLSNDLTWIKTKIKKNCQNPQWEEVLSIPIFNLSDFVEIELNSSGLLGNTKLGEYKISTEEISNEIEKKIIKLAQGSITILIKRGKNKENPFKDYKEEEKIIIAEKATLGIKLLGLNRDYKKDGIENISACCLLKLGNIEQKTRIIDFCKYPHWNQLFYFDVPSYSTSVLSIQILNVLNKDTIFDEFKIPIKDLKKGVVETGLLPCFDMITHLIEPGKTSFESNPFNPNTIVINLQNIGDNISKTFYCKIKLKGDEFWRYTKPGKFNDFFSFEYIDQDGAMIIMTDGQNSSEEVKVDITEFKEHILFRSIGKIKVNLMKEIRLDNSISKMTFNLLIKEVTSIKKEPDKLWIIEVNDESTGYSYDGKFFKYFIFPVNSLISDFYKIVLYKEEKGKKKEIDKFGIYISSFKIGIPSEDYIESENNLIKYEGHISLPNMRPFVLEKYNPLIMHIFVIEARNIPTKMDLYVSCRLERDEYGAETSVKEKTTTPQWFEFIEFTITDEKEDLIIELFSKSGKKSKLICNSKVPLKKYLNEEIYYEWIKMDKIVLNIALQIKREGESFMTRDDIDKYINSDVEGFNQN